MSDKGEVTAARLQDGDALVAEYLSHHPDFLQRHPEVLERLVPPQRWTGNRVVDMTQVMVERLRGEIDRLRLCTSDLITNSRANMSILERVHASVLALVEVRTLDKLVECLRDDVAAFLAVDAVNLAFETAQVAPFGPLSPDIGCLDNLAVDYLLGGPTQPLVLRARVYGEEEVYGVVADLIRSDAVVRLRPSNGPLGVLAIGSRHEGEFDPGQSTDLLLFLARVVERCVARLLKD